MRSEQGSALVIAVLIIAVMTLLGVSFLLMADTENKIAENEKLSAQALYFGEGVVREVKRWFDRPPYSTAGDRNMSRPTTAIMDRQHRMIDPDGAGPTASQAADGSDAHPYYKAGIDLDHDGHDDIFDKPYRGDQDQKDPFLGTADGPDVRIDRANADAAAFLDDLARRMLPDFPAGANGVLARINTIDVYGPPYLDAGGGNWTRYGVATISVRLQIVKHPGAADEQVLADRTIKAVVNEAPYGAVFGPFHSCDELSWGHAFNVHWGPATAVGAADVPTPTPPNGMAKSIPRDLPATPRVDLLHFHLLGATTQWNTLKGSLNNTVVEDPWFQFFAGLSVTQWSGLGTPQVYPPSPNSQDQSNKFQEFPSVPCPKFDYDTWKAIARSGGSDVHYYAWAAGNTFREDAIGDAKSFQDFTDGKQGLFFFDTKDGQAPHDFDASSVAANLTPGITISGGGYGTSGFIYLNTEIWRVSGSPGRVATFTFPGEPFRDLNEDGVWQQGEDFINLKYTGLANIDDPITVDATDTFDPANLPPAAPHVVWNSKGPSVPHDAIVWGILYLSGQFDSSGTPYYDGSVVTFAGTESGVKTPGTANLYFDPNLKGSWPPVGWNLPRVVITRWETDE